MTDTPAIQFNVDAALAKLGELVTKHGPQAVDLAASVVQVEAVNDLLGFPGWIATMLFFLWGARLAQRKAGADRYDESAWGFVIVLAFGAAGLCFIAALTALLNVWSWVALFNPKLALAHHILSKLTGL